MALDISKINFPEEMNIREAALFLGIGEQRIRALVRSGELTVEKRDNANVFKKGVLQAFKDAPRKTGGRKEGNAGKAYVIHVTGDKLAAVQDALGKIGVQLEPRYNYEKMRAYQKGRRDKLNAQKRAASGNGQAQTQTASTQTATPAAPAEKTTRSLLGGRRTS
jgi:hypothetical protein